MDPLEVSGALLHEAGSSRQMQRMDQGTSVPPLPRRVRGREVVGFSSVDRRVSSEAQSPLGKLQSPGRERGLCKLRLPEEISSTPAPCEPPMMA